MTNKLPKLVRVLLADDHALVRAGVRALLEKMSGVEVAGEASDGREVLNLVATQRPDVVLMDITMPGLNGLETTTRIAREFPGVRVIIVSMHSDEDHYWSALKAGAAGYLLKISAAAELETALHRVSIGEIYVSREISTRIRNVVSSAAIAGRKSRLEQLTERQREILQLIAEGQNTKGIAGILNVSPKTVEYHRVKLMECLNLHDVPALVRFALRTGLISQEA